MFRQLSSPPGHVKERVYPKQVSQEGDAQRYGELNTYLPDGLKFVYAIVALLSEGKYDVILSAPNRMIEMENLRPLRAELPAVWSNISNALR